jgi:hypothetical protein
MFGPHASPVVNAHITWQIGPGDVRLDLAELRVARDPLLFEPGEPVAHLRQLASIQRRAQRLLGRVRHERRGARDPVAQHLGPEPADSAAARAPRYSESESDPSVCASGTKTSSSTGPLDELPSGSVSS